MSEQVDDATLIERFPWVQITHDSKHLYRGWLDKKLLKSARNRVASCLTSRNREQHEEGIEFEIIQATDLILNSDEHGQNIVAGRLPLLRGDFLSIGKDLCRQGLAFRRGNRMLGIDAKQHVVGDREEPVTILFRYSEHIRDHVHRQLVGDLLNELDRFLFQRVLDDLDRPLAREIFEPLRHSRRETRNDSSPGKAGGFGNVSRSKRQ